MRRVLLLKRSFSGILQWNDALMYTPQDQFGKAKLAKKEEQEIAGTEGEKY